MERVTIAKTQMKCVYVVMIITNWKVQLLCGYHQNTHNSLKAGILIRFEKKYLYVHKNLNLRYTMFLFYNLKVFFFTLHKVFSAKKV